MAETKRTHRSKEERLAEIEKKITYHKAAITALEAKRDSILNPPKRKTRVGVGSVLKRAKEAGMTPQEMAEKLGIEL